MNFAGRTRLFIALAVCMAHSSCVIDPEKVPFDKSKYSICRVPVFDAELYIDNDTLDGIKRQLLSGIYWEEGIGRLIGRYTKRGTVAVDAGSHIGIHSIAMSRAVGPKGKVYSFEPQKKLYAEQLRNLEQNGCSNVLLYRKALGEQDGVINMCPYNPMNEGGQLIGRGGDEADMITLDSLNLRNVSLIKADVEYYEYFVFLGARETIMQCRPIIIFELLIGRPYEICPDHMKDQTNHNPKSLLESWGYTVTLIHGADYVAIPNEVVSAYPYPTSPTGRAEDVPVHDEERARRLAAAARKRIGRPGRASKSVAKKMRARRRRLVAKRRGEDKGTKNGQARIRRSPRNK